MNDTTIIVGPWDKSPECLEAERQQHKAVLAARLVERFGERCSDFEPNCTRCQRWRALDELFAEV